MVNQAQVPWTQVLPGGQPSLGHDGGVKMRGVVRF
jgi:hypothetical protein